MYISFTIVLPLKIFKMPAFAIVQNHDFLKSIFVVSMTKFELSPKTKVYTNVLQSGNPLGPLGLACNFDIRAH